MKFTRFCEIMFWRYPNMDGALLLDLCEVAFKEIKKEKGEM